MEKTPWFSFPQLPFRAGKYEISTWSGALLFAFWNERFFHSVGMPWQPFDRQRFFAWRGLVERCDDRCGEFCKECGGGMFASKAIRQTFFGSPDFLNDRHPVTMSPGGPGRLIDCMKCGSCGWSCTV